ncbi:hypothetical protein [Vibrio cholerae]|uniref:hypothetical protein n=6 Tax=Vibrio cholerae TaxID=666 RepID=UPI00053C89A3|nr:hypothetical protein [Vibrio cholerae]
MARQQANLEYNQFQSGLITEGNLLNLPIDSFREGENFILSKSNAWERRKGLGLEESGTTYPAYVDFSDQTLVSSVHIWQTHYSSIPEILVVQFGDKLHFFDTSVDPLSNGKLFINNQEFLTTEGTTEDIISGASVEGIFVFATEDADPVSLQITDITADASTARTKITVDRKILYLETRDVWGRAEPSKERPKTLTSDYQYDLLNQGWDAEKISATFAAIGAYPSGYDIWWLYKTTAGTDPNIIGKFTPSRMKDNTSTGIGQERQNTPAPRGSTVASLQVLASGKPSCIQTFAGRVFYAGFQATPRLINDVRPDFRNHVFFSQLVKSNAEISKCYQFADPTSEVDSAIVDTDGGFIKINAARKIVAMEEVSSGLFVIAENGVWLLSGTSDGLFSATGYHVDKITDYGCISPRSVVAYGDTVFYWAEEGIIVLSPDQTTGKHSAQNLTELKIQSLYNDLSTSSKLRSVGTVERTDKYVRWLVSENANPNNFDLEIIFSLRYGAFFINRFKSDITVAERVTGYIPERNVIGNKVVSDYFIVAGVDRVKVESADVTVPLGRRLGDAEFKDTKYLTIKSDDDSFGFYSFNQDNFKDFGLVDAEAYLLSAPQKLDDTQRRKQIASLATHMLRTDVWYKDLDGEVTRENESSMLLRIRWDYADSASSNKWTDISRHSQCYRYRRPMNLKQGVNVYPYEVITARERIRGSGTAFQFEFRTEPEKDCKLLGWAVVATGGTKV